MVTMNRSRRFKTVRDHHLDGWWPVARVRRAVKCGWITEAEMEEILNQEGPENDNA